MLCYYVSWRSEVRVVMSVTISAWKRYSVHLCLQLVVGRFMSYLRCLLFVCGVVMPDTCCVFVFLRIVCPVLPVSLNCPFWIAPSVFSNDYFHGDLKYYNCRLKHNNKGYNYIWKTVVLLQYQFNLHSSQDIPCCLVQQQVYHLVAGCQECDNGWLIGWCETPTLAIFQLYRDDEHLICSCTKILP